jgi:hypothetical protein
MARGPDRRRHVGSLLREQGQEEGVVRLRPEPRAPRRSFLVFPPGDETFLGTEFIIRADLFNRPAVPDGPTRAGSSHISCRCSDSITTPATGTTARSGLRASRTNPAVAGRSEKRPRRA